MGFRIVKVLDSIRRIGKKPEVPVPESSWVIFQRHVHEYIVLFRQWIARMGEINPRFPKIFIGLVIVAFIIVGVELYVTLVEFFYGDTKEYKTARAKVRNSKLSKKLSTAARVKLAAKALGEKELPGSEAFAKREAQVDLVRFLIDLRIHGLRVKRVKGQGKSTSPTKSTKFLRIASDGSLYFHTEGFKLKALVSSAESWPIETLASCLEGDANLGEVYLEFNAPRKANEILRIIVVDETERNYIVKAFNDIVQALTTQPHVIYDTCLNAEKIASQGESGLVDINSPAVLGSTVNKANMSPVTPQKMDRTPPGLLGLELGIITPQAKAHSLGPP